jgi:hypothetical protein
LNFYLGDSPYEEASKYEVKLDGESTMQLKGNTLDRVCLGARLLTEVEVKDYCEIFLLVESNSVLRERYTITVYRRETAIELTEGH